MFFPLNNVSIDIVDFCSKMKNVLYKQLSNAKNAAKNHQNILSDWRTNEASAHAI